MNRFITLIALVVAIILSGCDSREKTDVGSSYASGELKALGFYTVVDGHLSPLPEDSKSNPGPQEFKYPLLLWGRDYLILYGPEPAAFMNDPISIVKFDHKTGEWSDSELSLDGQMSREPQEMVSGQLVTNYVPRPTMEPGHYYLKRWISNNEIGRSYFVIYRMNNEKPE